VEPDEPFEENDNVEEGAEDPVVGEVPGVGVIDEDK